MDVTVIELLLIITFDRDNWFGFHQERRNEIQFHKRPESTEEKDDDDDGSGPED
jgi:hypothetical protein